MDAIVAGELFADLIMSGFAAWPEPGGEAFATSFHREAGGGAANTGCAMAKLGSKTAVLGMIGRDGEWLAERLRSFGVDTSHLSLDPEEPTGVTVAISTAAERTFLTYPGASARFPELLRSFSHFADARHVHIAWTPDLETIARIRGHGCSISIDTGWHEDWLSDPRSLQVLSEIDVYFPNHAEAQRITGESDSVNILRKFHAAGVRRVALKLGREGAALLWDGEIMRVDPVSVKAVDTTGAGDCFDAGFLHFWLRGESPLLCLRAANICGARSTEAYGGVSGSPDLESLRRELCAR